MVEHHVANVIVAGSTPVTRSIFFAVFIRVIRMISKPPLEKHKIFQTVLLLFKKTFFAAQKTDYSQWQGSISLHRKIRNAGKSAKNLTGITSDNLIFVHLWCRLKPCGVFENRRNDYSKNHRKLKNLSIFYILTFNNQFA